MRVWERETMQHGKTTCGKTFQTHCQKGASALAQSHALIQRFDFVFLIADYYFVLKDRLRRSLKASKVLRSVNTDVLFVLAVCHGLAQVICSCWLKENAQSEEYDWHVLLMRFLTEPYTLKPTKMEPQFCEEYFAAAVFTKILCSTKPSMTPLSYTRHYRLGK